MIRSMTGYGRGEGSDESRTFTVEIRSVNHRFLETVVRMPRMYNALEDSVRKTVASQLARGRVDVFISVETRDNQNRVVKVDKDLALAYYNSLKDLAGALGTTEKVELIDIARFPDVVTLEEADVDLEQIWETLKIALTAALDKMVEMRSAEGSRLKEDLLHRIGKIDDLREQIYIRAPGVVNEYKEKLQARISELLNGVEVDEARLATEVAFFADRSNITEELVRLKSHLQQFREALESLESIGRKLDFLVQELNREVNTVGSKGNDLAIGSHVIAAKSEIEKIREQVQNIE